MSKKYLISTIFQYNGNIFNISQKTQLKHQPVKLRHTSNITNIMSLISYAFIKQITIKQNKKYQKNKKLSTSLRTYALALWATMEGTTQTSFTNLTVYLYSYYSVCIGNLLSYYL